MRLLRRRPPRAGARAPTSSDFAWPNQGRKIMSTKSSLAALAAVGLAAMALPALAADVTPQRLLATAGEPQNWLMVHHDYNNSRHSPLSLVNRDNVKDM